MERTPQCCMNCLFWRRILEEGSAGTPMLPARPGWGQCTCHNLTQIRIKGFLETQERHWCTCYGAKNLEPEATASVARFIKLGQIRPDQTKLN